MADIIRKRAAGFSRQTCQKLHIVFLVKKTCTPFTYSGAENNNASNREGKKNFRDVTNNLQEGKGRYSNK
jgi:hypothetical protein